MKRLFVAFALALTVFGLRLPASAQAEGLNPEEELASLKISRNILRLINALPKEFEGIKGDFVTKTVDSTSVFNVKDINNMMADNQYVMEKRGKTYYIANYSSDVKKRELLFAAFTDRMKAITNADTKFSIEQDNAKSVADKLVYTISLNGARVGSYTLLSKKNEGTLIIGLL